MKNSTTQTAQAEQDYLHGAALVDSKGKETPITEEMIQKALEEILQATKS
ncbi:hypothetical protein NBRC116188_05130 [Oceaniserpentilla sp. 4NH20-0058]